MASFDYDVVIIGSGFGGSVAALRAAEKGYRVGVTESGKRWKDEDIPRLPPVSTHIVGANFRTNAISTAESNIPIELLLPNVCNRLSISFVKSLRRASSTDSQNADHSESFMAIVVL